MPAQPLDMSTHDYEVMRGYIRTNLSVVDYPMEQLVDWTVIPNADLLQRGQAYAFPEHVTGIAPPELFGKCYEGVNGKRPPLECEEHGHLMARNYHLTELGLDILIMLMKVADRDGFLLYLNFCRAKGFAPQQANLTASSQQLLDFWKTNPKDEPHWMFEYCCGDTPLRRNYRGRRWEVRDQAN